jgi:hypothetical protein
MGGRLQIADCGFRIAEWRLKMAESRLQMTEPSLQSVRCGNVPVRWRGEA